MVREIQMHLNRLGQAGLSRTLTLVVECVRYCYKYLQWWHDVVPCIRYTLEVYFMMAILVVMCWFVPESIVVCYAYTLWWRLVRYPP